MAIHDSPNGHRTLLGTALLLTIMSGVPSRAADGSASPPGSSSFIEPAAYRPSSNKQSGVNWTGVVSDSLRFLALEHGFRVLTEPGTRAGLNQIPRGYINSVTNLHGWGDGDEFYVNYVGHPMQGATSGYIWAQNDRRFYDVEFGRDRRYWKSRMRATAFSFVYSTQFEIGPISEASIGQVQAHHPQQGMVDLILTPALGLGWMLAEDSLDKYAIRWIESRTTNSYVRALVRGGLNPSRSLANVLGGRLPWARDNRNEAALSYVPVKESKETATEERPGVAPFEFSVTSSLRTFTGSNAGDSCLGGGGTGAFRLAPTWQLVADVNGCSLSGLKPNTSGDSLTYLIGPRWAPLAGGRWSPYFQVLAGGRKLVIEETSPETKRVLELTAQARDLPPPIHADYTQTVETSGLSLAAGAGLDVKLNSALALRIASVDYTRSWVSNIAGNSYRSDLHFTSGLILRFGTW